MEVLNRTFWGFLPPIIRTRDDRYRELPSAPPLLPSLPWARILDCRFQDQSICHPLRVTEFFPPTLSLEL